VQTPPVQREPTVAAATPAGWRNWLFNLFHFGRRRLAELGLTLSLGFASALLALYLFAGLADEVAERETHQLDDAVLVWLAQWQSPGLDLAARVVSALGSELLAVLLVGLLLVLGWQRRWGAAIGLLLTVGGAQLLNNVLKDLFHRTRPAPVEGFIPAQAFSFPSGHAMVSAAFYLFVAYLAWRLLRGRIRLVCLALLLLLVLLIGLSRLYLGVHFLTDVLAGYAAGFAWTQSVVVGGRLLARRSAGRRMPGPAAAAGETALSGGKLAGSS
jgi:undecaprenyl-diphosphatase